MLKELYISNFALINEVNVKFDENFNIIMGETGSGKSSLINALSILLGDRASKDKIRKDQDMAFISAAFDIKNNFKVMELLKEQNIYIEDELLIISREINKTSSSVSRINNRIVSLNFIKDISRELIDIYGQFENITILNSQEQRNFIDRLGDENHYELLNIYREKFVEYSYLLEDYKKFKNPPEEVNRNLEFLEFQINEIENSNVLDINEDELESKLKIIENTADLRKDSYEILNYLDNNDGINSTLGKIVNLSEDIEKIDLNFKSNRERFNSLYLESLDLKSEILNYVENLEIDSEEYDKLQTNRKNLYEIKRKYGNSLEEIAIFLKKLKLKLDEILNYEEILETKRINLKNSKDELEKLAEKISENRKYISSIFIERIINELYELEINNAMFDIEFKETGLTVNGKDNVNFLISFNKNEPLKLFSEVASGGEISRFMLAVKSITADRENIPTLIFDEIDSGLSGNASNIVGRKLKKLSVNHQLIVISHLPQIISKADTQFLVYKEDSDYITKSFVEKLDYNRRIEEIAKVIEGDNYSESTYISAKNMVDENLKNL